MAKKTDESKLADTIEQTLNNNWFNPHLCASIIVNQFPLYNLEKLMELMKAVIQEQAGLYNVAWQEGYTSEALMLSSHLAEVIEMHQPIN